MGAIAELESATDKESDATSWRVPLGDLKLEPVQTYAAYTIVDPKSIAEARRTPEWLCWEDMIEAELLNLREHEVYELVETPRGAHVHGSKVVLHAKYGQAGEVEQFKARIVAQGCGQLPSEYGETFASVEKMGSLRLMIVLAARCDWNIIQLDVKSAYPNGNLDEETYMRQPTGTAAPVQEHLAWRLKKTLYSLKQAGHKWYKVLRGAMSRLGMSRREADYA